MHEFPSWLSIIGIGAAILAVIVFTIMTIRNKNMKVGVGKDGPYVETKNNEAPPPAGDNNISDVKVKARDVRGGVRIGHDNPRKK